MRLICSGAAVPLMQFDAVVVRGMRLPVALRETHTGIVAVLYPYAQSRRRRCRAYARTGSGSANRGIGLTAYAGIRGIALCRICRADLLSVFDITRILRQNTIAARLMHNRDKRQRREKCRRCQNEHRGPAPDYGRILHRNSLT